MYASQGGEISIARLPNEEVKLSIAISSRTGMILGYS
jgi:hypothetical protein